MNRIVKRMAVPVGAAIILGSSGFAFMATNTVPESFAGQGQNTISSYVVSNISYDLTTDLGHNGDVATSSIQWVDFTLNQKAKTVQAKINGTNYNTCFNNSGDGETWRCEPQNAGHGA